MIVEPMPEHPPGYCTTCRGRSWLDVRTRPVYWPGALTLPCTLLARETWWDCGGEGRQATDSAERGAWLEGRVVSLAVGISRNLDLLDRRLWVLGARRGAGSLDEPSCLPAISRASGLCFRQRGRSVLRMGRWAKPATCDRPDENG